jgi:hypothetical protein
MKDSKSLHLKLQEYADCYSESDALQELEGISKKGVGDEVTGDTTDLALKYLASAIFHAIEEGAEKVQISRVGVMEGECKLLGKTEKSLPKPPAGLAKEMVEILRCITDLEDDVSESKLAYGFRNERMELALNVHKSGEKEVMGIALPRR